MEPVFDKNGVPRLRPTPGFAEYRDVIEAAIKHVADEWGVEVKPYSGRYMYQATCLSVVVDDAREFVTQAAGAAAATSRLKAGELLADAAVTESMATKTIVYWPDLTVR